MTLLAALLLLTLPPVPTLMWPFQPRAVVGDYEVRLVPAMDGGGRPVALELELRARGQANGANLLEAPPGGRPLRFSAGKDYFTVRRLPIHGSRQRLRIEYLGAIKTEGSLPRRAFRRLDLLVTLEEPPR